MMKRSVILLCAALLLVGCDARREALSYVNTPAYCQLGETVYHNGNGSTVYNADFNRISLLCRDPLCSHNGDLCPESVAFKGVPKRFQTDGERLYMKVRNLRKSISGTAVYEIYAIDPTDSDMELICEFEADGYGAGGFFVNGSHVYYTAGRYKEGYDPASGDSEDMYTDVMEVPISGGRAKSLFEEELPIGTGFFTCGEYHYLLHRAADMDGSVTRIHAETGECARIAFDNLRINSVMELDGEILYLCDEEAVVAEYEQRTVLTPQTVIWQKSEEDAVLLAEHAGNVMLFEGAVWYSDFEVRYHGSTEMPTGNGKETVLADVITEVNSMLHRVDIESGEKTSWDMSREDGYVTLRMMGMSGGQAILYINRIDGELNQQSEVKVVELREDQTFSEIKSLK